jgi:hypothetical protein
MREFQWGCNGMIVGNTFQMENKDFTNYWINRNIVGPFRAALPMHNRTLSDGLAVDDMRVPW